MDRRVKSGKKLGSLTGKEINNRSSFGYVLCLFFVTFFFNVCVCVRLVGAGGTGKTD